METIAVDVDTLIVIVLFVLGIIGALFGILYRKVDKIDDRLRDAERILGQYQERFTWYESLVPGNLKGASLMIRQSSDPDS